MNQSTALLMSCTVLGLLTGCVWSADRSIAGGTGGGGGISDEGAGGARGFGGRIALDSGVAPDADLTADTACAVQMYDVNSTPDLLILQDKSLSMNDSPGSGTGSKWVQMTAAINQVVSATPSAWWGLKFFGDVASDLCGVAAGVAVPPAANSAAAIAAAIAATSPSSSTPTRVAIGDAAAYLRTLTDPNQRYIILATDGLPTCAAGSNNTQATDAMGAEMAVTTEATNATQPIKTFVIGIATSGDATATATLTQMAMNGGTGQPYFPVSNSADLVAALSTIQGTTKSCTFPLGQTPPNPSNIKVTGDGTTIPPDTTNTNGWNYTGTGYTTIQLFGQACTDYTTNVIKTVSVILGCMTKIPG